MSLPADFEPQREGLLREILWARGFRDQADIRRFLEPRLSDIPHPEDLLADLPIALERLVQARDAQQEVIVFGDYDVDGTTSAVLLTTVLRDLGFKVSTFIPHRVKEGYGVSLKASDALLARFPQARLVITCDCGMASFEGIENLRQNGIDTIVTDHHEVPDVRVAALAVINPKQAHCLYPEKSLAGVGVAFLLVMALRRRLDRQDYRLIPFLELVALGTVCDVAELKGLNRTFVKLGLSLMANSSWPALRWMFQQQNCALPPKSRDLGFVIGPRLNASGRIGEPDLGFRLLMAKSESDVLPLALECESMNRQRRELQDKQIEDALRQGKQLFESGHSRASLVIVDPSFHLGIVGLVASRLSQNFERPVCVLTELTDEHALADFGQEKARIFKGSLRAPRGYHLADALKSLQIMDPDFFLSAGGHALAAGIAMKPEKVAAFREAFEQHFLSRPVVADVTEVDLVLREPSVPLSVLNALEPFGPSNPKPRLRLQGLQLQDCRVMKSIHLKILGRLQGKACEVLHFKSPWVKLLSERPQGEVLLDLIVEPLENSFQGKTKVEFELKDFVGMTINGKTVSKRTNEIGTSASA